jgi:tetratricopeptide (TPR) repeat protein
MLTPYDAHYQRGLDYYYQGIWSEAASQFAAALRIEPGLEMAASKLWSCLHRAGHAEDAAAVFRELLAAHPESAALGLQYARALERAGDPVGAEKQYRGVLADSPDNSRGHQMLAGLLAARGQRREAKQEYQAALRAHPGNGLAELELHILDAEDSLRDRGAEPGERERLARHYMAACRWDDALRELTVALPTGPDSVEGLLNTGQCLRLLGRSDEAAARYRDALRIDPRNTAAASGFSDAWWTTGRRSEAIEDARRLFEEDRACYLPLVMLLERKARGEVVPRKLDELERIVMELDVLGRPRDAWSVRSAITRLAGDDLESGKDARMRAFALQLMDARFQDAPAALLESLVDRALAFGGMDAVQHVLVRLIAVKSVAELDAEI